MISEFIQELDHFSHCQLVRSRIQFIMDTDLFFLLLEFFEFLQPVRINFLLDQLSKKGKGFPAITPNRNSCFYILIYFGRINIKMNNLSLLGIFIKSPCDPVVKPHPNSYQYIALIGEYVRSVIAMHAKHTHVQGIIRWNGA